MNLNNEMYTKYPRVAPTAEIFGFNVKDIDSLVSKMNEDLKAELNYSLDQKQLALKSIIMRLGLKKEEFIKYIGFVRENSMPDEVLVSDCGKYNLDLYKALVK